MATETIKTAAQMASNFMGINFRNRFSFRRSYDVFTCQEIIANKRRNTLVRLQKLEVAEHAELGSDIAVAKFVLNLSGRVRCCDGKWITDYRKLPRDYNDSFKLSAIELTKTSLVTEGIDNFVGLDHLESLDLSENFLLDDFACDQLSRQFRNSKTLKYLNLNKIPFLTVYGLEILLRIQSLRTISAFGTQASEFEDIDLFTLAAQDERDCKVMVHEDGRQFRSQELEVAYRDTRLEAKEQLKVITSGK